MAKKKNNIGKILYGLAVVLGLVALAMIFVDAVELSMKGISQTEGLTGLEVAFGRSENDVKILEFSIMALLPVILAVAGVVLSALQAVAKKGSKLLDFVIVACFVVAGVLYFVMPSFVVYSDAMALFKDAYVKKLAIGSIVSAVCSILAGVVVLAKSLLKK